MNDKQDYRKLIGERFMAAHRMENAGTDMTREQFERLILISEFKKDIVRKRRERLRMRVAAACIAMFMMFGGMAIGINISVNANADRDKDRNMVMQDGNVIISNGIVKGSEHFGISTSKYTSLDAIPEEVKSEIHLLYISELEFKKTRIMVSGNTKLITTSYMDIDGYKIEVQEESNNNSENSLEILKNYEGLFEYKGITVISQKHDEGMTYYFNNDDVSFDINIPNESKIKKETILDGLIG